MFASSVRSRFVRTRLVRIALGLYAVSALYGCGTEGASRLDSRDADVVEAELTEGDVTEPDVAQTDTDARIEDEGPPPSEDPRPAVLFLGNSLTAGLGVDRAEAFPSLIQSKIDQDGLGLRVINAGVSGETTGGGLSRLDWLLENDIVALVLELGANDGLRGAPPEAVEENLQAIIDRARARHPRLPIVLAGMQAPPNMGRVYADAFRDLFPRLAERNSAALIPFLLDGVAADRHLNQADGIHPTAEGHTILAETVWETLEPVLEGLSER